MKNTLKTLASSALFGLLLVLPFAILEVVNRREFHEAFPLALFSGLWLTLFAIGLILLPIFQAVRSRKRAGLKIDPAAGQTAPADPRPAAIASLVLVGIFALLSVLNFLGWESLKSPVNSPYTELPGRVLSLVLFTLPIAAGLIASGPVAGTLRNGGRLFAHPLHLLIVVVVTAFLIAGLIGLLVDQWPCFMGIPVCD